jgi:hypothetical protein
MGVNHGSLVAGDAVMMLILLPSKRVPWLFASV